MIQDPKLMAAVSRILQRSERQEDIRKLVETYVDVGLLPQLNNSNHQIFYGRRGTGKTHVIKVLEAELKKDVINTVCYIDTRTLGSTSQFSDNSIPIPRRCLSLFRDFLMCIYHSLLEHIIEEPSGQANEALEEVDNLANLITEPLKVFKTEKLKTEEQSSSSTESVVSAGGKITPAQIEVKTEATGKLASLHSDKEEIQYTVETQDKLIFPELQRSLRLVLKLAKTKLFVLVDEWSSLPLDIQPYLAEFFKRGLLPLNTATLKVGALEYRCRFSELREEGLLGFELGADIATAPDLDDYFVFDRNPDQVTDIYADVLLKHLSSELPDDYLRDQYSIVTPRQFSSRLFTERKTSILKNDG